MLTSKGPRRARRGVALAVAVLAAGCSGSGFVYVENPEVGTYFKVPEDWRLFSEDEVFSGEAELSPQQEAATRAAQWVMAFDAAPQPSLSNVLTQRADHPTGFVRVRLISDTEWDSYSLSTLRNEVIAIDRRVEASEAELLMQEDVVVDDGLHGAQVVFNYLSGDTFVTINQMGLLDPKEHLVYVFLVGCEASCYLDYEQVIEEVVSSWTVTKD